MRLLVSGGAGYIGSHMCKLLAEAGHEVAVVDNLSTGHREAVQWGRLYEGNLADDAFLDGAFASARPEGVVHFAASSLIGESNVDPAAYYRNNVAGTLKLLDRVRRIAGCPFIFSSSASVFGTPRQVPIPDGHPCAPINAYGRTKLAVEFALHDYAAAYGLSSVSFRYFNAAGAAPPALIGESHRPETHLIPNLLEAALGRREALTIFGDDYDTPDGTCIRDYIHVNDLCRAHLLGLEFLRREPGAHVFNLGNGIGFSVREVIAVGEQVVGRPLPYRVGPRRQGDPSRLVADFTQARARLGWIPEYDSLRGIVETAWSWHRERKF